MNDTHTSLKNSLPVDRCDKIENGVGSFTENGHNQIEKTLLIDLKDVFYSSTKFIEFNCSNESNQIDVCDKNYSLFVPIHVGCSAETKLIYRLKNNDKYPGDIIFTINDDDRSNGDVFRRGGDIFMLFKISLKDALCGFKITVKTIDERHLKLAIADVIAPGYIKTIRNEGLPIIGSNNSRGDLHIIFKIDFPKRLSTDFKEELSIVLNKMR